MSISGTVGQGARNEHDDVKTVQILLNINGQAFGLLAPLAEDGVVGSATLAAIENFQGKVMRLPNPNSPIIPGGDTIARLRAGLGQGFNAAKLKGTMIHATDANVIKFSPPLDAKMRARDISTPLRQAHFLAQVGHESGELRYVKELASGQAYEGRGDLGNTEPGDGPRFKGRGLIQLTGRANYRDYGNAIGKNLLVDNNWDLVADDPELAVDVACWFWIKHNLNQFADQDDITTITRRINGGLTGFDQRKALLVRAKFFLPGPA